MKTRIITAVVMTAVLIPFFIFSETWAFPLLIAFLAGLGVYEMLRCIGVNNVFYSVIGVAFAAFQPILARFVSEANRQSDFQHYNKVVLSLFLGTAIIFVLAILIYAMFSKGKTDVGDASTAALFSVYVALGFVSLMILRDDFCCGWFYVFLPFVISWTTDTFAYFCGMAFGKHKLIPDVSPKKTVEGSVGGTLCSVILTLVYGFVFTRFGYNVNYLFLAAVALVCSFLSQCGDLLMSLVKRRYGIKDYGKLFPGHGGVLDRFDSIILCSLSIMFFLCYVPGVYNGIVSII